MDRTGEEKENSCLLSNLGLGKTFAGIALKKEFQKLSRFLYWNHFTINVAENP